ncbi:MAG: 1-(5-phosphoribosyl)-5-[(5-phosphoribosylamino)methylideneamino] imidazole-4-carboxamide isomerase [Planctomycetota bacterium]
MLIIPAVDIKDGKAVRLRQGLAEQQTVYDADPVHAARRWAEAGAKRIHVVDLDGAFEGQPRNRELTLAILRALRPPSQGTARRIEIEIGGGLRDAAAVSAFLDAGAARCVLGTKALDDRAFLTDLAARYPGRINAGLDARDGRLVTQGWVQQSATLATDLVRSLAGLPLGEVIYTDIERDGMLSGPNLKRLEEMKKASPFPLIASGGISALDHVRACRALGCFGAIVGKAFYDGALEIREAMAAAGDA